jgi:hypothetical protein
VNRINCIPAETVLFSQIDFGLSHVSVTCACLWHFKTSNFSHARRNIHNVSKFCVVLSYFGVLKCEVHLILSSVNVHAYLLGVWTCG